MFLCKIVGAISLVFIVGLLKPAWGSGCCTTGFPSLQQLISAENTVPPPNISSLQGIFPTFRITCNGILRRIIYRSTARGPNPIELFDLWRETFPGSGNYSILVKKLIVMRTLLTSINNNINVYTFEIGIPVQENDFIGIVSFTPTTFIFLDLGHLLPGSTYRIPADTYQINDKENGTRIVPLISAIVFPPSQVDCVPNEDIFPTMTQTYPIISPTSPTPLPTTTTAPKVASSSANSQTIIVAAALSGVVLLLLIGFPLVICTSCCIYKYSKTKKMNLSTETTSRNEFRLNQYSRQMDPNLDDNTYTEIGNAQLKRDNFTNSLTSNAAYSNPENLRASNSGSAEEGYGALYQLHHDQRASSGDAFKEEDHDQRGGNGASIKEGYDVLHQLHHDQRASNGAAIKDGYDALQFAGGNSHRTSAMYDTLDITVEPGESYSEINYEKINLS